MEPGTTPSSARPDPAPASEPASRGGRWVALRAILSRSGASSRREAAGAAPHGSARRARRRRVAWVLGAAAVLAAGYAWQRRRRSAEAAPESVSSASRGDIESRFLDAGELEPVDFVDVASKVGGRVIELAVREGSRVRPGDRLAVVQPGRTEGERFVPVTVTSPMGGTVMRYQRRGSYQEEGRLAKLGDYVTGIVESNSPTYLMTVADLSRLVVTMKISEMDILKLREGMPVSVAVDALPGEALPAHVRLVAPKAEKDSNNLKSFRVEVELEKADGRLKPGMTARVDGLLEARRGVLKVPLAAVFEEGSSAVAYVRGEEGRHRRSVLKLGLRNESEVEVLDGLKEGEAVLTEKPKDAAPPGGPAAGGK